MPDTILLSIKPAYVEEILNGQKRYEFRKVVPKKTPKKIVIYSTAPVKMLVGEVEVWSVIEGTPTYIWNEAYPFTGISDTDYYKYFKGRDKAFAYHLGEVKIYDPPIDPKEVIDDFRAPQNFQYLYDYEYREIERRAKCQEPKK